MHVPSRKTMGVMNNHMHIRDTESPKKQQKSRQKMLCEPAFCSCDENGHILCLLTLWVRYRCDANSVQDEACEDTPRQRLGFPRQRLGFSPIYSL